MGVKGRTFNCPCNVVAACAEIPPRAMTATAKRQAGAFTNRLLIFIVCFGLVVVILGFSSARPDPGRAMNVATAPGRQPGGAKRQTETRAKIHGTYHKRLSMGAYLAFLAFSFTRIAF